MQTAQQVLTHPFTISASSFVELSGCKNINRVENYELHKIFSNEN